MMKVLYLVITHLQGDNMEIERVFMFYKIFLPLVLRELQAFH
jgi:hypothetical protein